MLLKLESGVFWKCTSIYLNLSPRRCADDTHSPAYIEDVIRSARQMGSFLAVCEPGLPLRLIDPNTIVSAT